MQFDNANAYNILTRPHNYSHNIWYKHSRTNTQTFVRIDLILYTL